MPRFRPPLAHALTLAVAGACTTVPAAEHSDRRFEQGLSAYKRGDGLQAGDFWEPCALAGDAHCQYGLGVLFDDGAPQWPKNSATALQWLRRAALQGHVDAQIRLGFLYAVGRDDLEQDIREAYVWFSMAAAGGSEQAKNHRARVVGLMTEAELVSANRMLVERGIEYHFDNSASPSPSPSGD